MDRAIYRIFDANINRTKEGLRVCEEITRFILNNRSLTTQLKNIRHRIDLVLKNMPSRLSFIAERESRHDIGRGIFGQELKRKGVSDILFANMQRAKESTRVLEEFAKLINRDTALEFKEIRYKIYETEKKIAAKIAALRHSR
ncbi:MAG: thiamine-phosphate pyrophosphorylase [Candidatus Omnitrophica bacterium]|nr:thiamine-phosphate pyrophosphorylase [Candidatus Omnitrophota bacterium]